MEQHHKDVLRKNRVALVNDMDLTYIFDGLVQRKIFRPADWEDFKAENNSRKRNQQFLTALERRGPNAFRAFVDSLREHDHGWLADMLDSSSAPDPTQQPFRPGRVECNPTGAIPGPQGDSEPMGRTSRPAQTVVASPSDELKGVAWPENSPSLLTDVTIPVSLPSASDDASDADNVYRMKSKPRGIAVIINNKHFTTMKTRVGTDVDRDNLKHVFKQLGFNTEVREDQNSEQMKAIFRGIASRDHERFDCFILAILSHGRENGVLGTDEEVIAIEHITSYFDRCPTLLRKPKLFFLQACRGEMQDVGHDFTDSAGVPPSDATAREDSVAPMSDDELACRMFELELGDDVDASYAIKSKLPSQSDMLLAYATLPGFVSWRNTERGSWFVQALCEVFLNHSHNEDLLSMMTMVNDKVARAFESSSGRKKQMPAPVMTLRKKLFFKPGL